jgi:hypothetical protein
MTIAATTSIATPDTIARASATRHPLSVYDGTTWIGHLVRRGNDFEAVDINGVSHGMHASMQRAAFSLPARNAP